MGRFQKFFHRNILSDLSKRLDLLESQSEKRYKTCLLVLFFPSFNCFFVKWGQSWWLLPHASDLFLFIFKSSNIVFVFFLNWLVVMQGVIPTLASANNLKSHWYGCDSVKSPGSQSDCSICHWFQSEYNKSAYDMITVFFTKHSSRREFGWAWAFRHGY